MTPLFDLGLVLVVSHPSSPVRHELVWLDCGLRDRQTWWEYAGHRYRWTDALS